MNLQGRYDLEVAEDNLAGKLKKEVHTYQAAQVSVGGRGSQLCNEK